MSGKSLVIFPGAGDPNSEQYTKVYDSIVLESKNRGYSDTLILGWPGHLSYNKKNRTNQSLNFNTSVDEGIERLREYELRDVPYDIICRSYGCGVFLKACEIVRPNNIKFASLWGPPPYFKLFDIFVRELNSTTKKSTDKGVIIDDTLFKSLIPTEILVESFVGNFDLRIGFGAEDEIVPKSTAKMYQELNPSVRCKLVPGAKHSVVMPSEVYYDLLFGE